MAAEFGLIEEKSILQDFEEEKSAVAMPLDLEEDVQLELIPGDSEEPLKVSRKAALISKLIFRTLEPDGEKPREKQETTIPIPGVKKASLEYVIEYMEHHKGEESPLVEKPLRHKEMAKVCKDPWDAEFAIRVWEHRQRGSLFPSTIFLNSTCFFLLSGRYDLVKAANYMDIQGLLHLVIACLASLIRGGNFLCVPTGQLIFF